MDKHSFIMLQYSYKFFIKVYGCLSKFYFF